MVRQRSAKPLCPSSNLGGASRKKKEQVKDLLFLFSTKFAFGEWNLASPSEIASLWNICFANVKGEFHFTSNGVRYFTISARKLFHIRRQPNISLLSPSSLEKHRKCAIMNPRKAVELWKKVFLLRYFVFYRFYWFHALFHIPLCMANLTLIRSKLRS